MDTKKLAALAAAVRLGSFTRAAEELGYTQSGLTHMMNSLEKDVGFPVLVRSRSGVRLTPAGQRIFPLVQECLAGAEALEREILLINTHQEESVRVAAYDSIARHWLPEVIQQFRRNQPGIGVDIQMGSVQEVYRWVQEGRVDLCFASRQESVALDWIPMQDDELLAILPPDYDNGGRSAFPVEEFTGKEFLMPSMGFTHAGAESPRRHAADPHYPGVGQRHPLHGRARSGRQYAVAPGAARASGRRTGPAAGPAGRPRAGHGLPSPQGAAPHGPAVHGRSAGNDRENVTLVRILCWNFRN